MPLLLRYKTAIKKNKLSGLFAGPYVSMNLKAVRQREIEGIREKARLSNMKDIDFGVIAGFSYDIDLRSGQLVIDLRSSYSLINVMERIDGFILWYYGPSREYVRNVSVSFTVGYRFLNIGANKTKKQ